MTGTGRFVYGKSGLEEGTELKNTGHRSRTAHESAKTLSSMKSKNYTMIDEVDVEQGMPMPPSPTHRQPESTRHGPGNTTNNNAATAGVPMGWSGEAGHDVPTKQSMPTVGLSKETKAMEVLGMTGVSTHVSSGRTSQPYFHPDSAGHEEFSGESLSGIAVKRSVTVEMISTPTTPGGMRRTKPREF